MPVYFYEASFEPSLPLSLQYSLNEPVNDVSSFDWSEAYCISGNLQLF